MSRYTTVIFDLDGTLTDSAEGILAAIRYALDKMGVPCPPAGTLRRFLGPPLADSFAAFCGMTEEDAARATAYYRERYIPQGMLENRVYPGIPALLRRLRGMGVRLAIATGKPLNTAKPILEHFGLWDLFDAAACPEPGDMHADKALLIGRVLTSLPGAAPERTLMVGDIPGDIQGGRRAGCDTCAALWGYGDDGEMAAAGPTHACADVAALTRLLCGDASCHCSRGEQ